MPPKELAAVYDSHATALFHFLRSLCQNETEARDVLQEVFIKLAQSPDPLSSAHDPRAFLIRMARNQVIDLARRQEARKRYHLIAAEGDMFAASPNLDEEVFRQALEHALVELPEDQRMVVHLKLWQGMTFEAIAAVLEIPLNTAASRYRYGLDKLRARLRPIYNEIQ